MSSRRTEVLYTTGYFPGAGAGAEAALDSDAYSAGVNHALSHQPIVQAEDIVVTTTSGIHASNMAQYCLMMQC